MSLEQLGRTINEQSQRRKLLRTAGAASVAALAGVLSRTVPSRSDEISDVLATFPYHGCRLCFKPANHGGPRCPDLRCAWCWYGDCHGERGNRHQNLCCEGYAHGSGGSCCEPGCVGVRCSFLGEYSRPCQGYDEQSRCTS
ncbi:MAG TPA: hypothetical protein VF529_13730 [Solirubrobacteraceae bacterium]|jgi:hypothetical protein